MVKEYLEEVPCEICGSWERQFERRFGKWSLVRCGGCGLVFLNPRLRREILEKSFDGKTGMAGEVHLEGDLSGYYESIRGQQVRAFNRELNRLERKVPVGRILDVGCGSGLFLELARSRGWEVAGLEIGSWAEPCLKRRGIDYFLGLLEDSPFEENSFDAVFLWSTLEHVAHPLCLARRAKQILRKGGVFWVAGMANYDSLLNRLGLEDFSDNQPPGVVYYFSPRTLRALMEKAGFSRVEVTSEWLSRKSLRAVLYPLKPVVHFFLNRFALGSAFRAVACKE